MSLAATIRSRVRPVDNARELWWVMPASASSRLSSPTRCGGICVVASLTEKPYRISKIPSDAAPEMTFSKHGVCVCPTAESLVSTNRTAVERLVDSSWRIISSPLRATLGQWIRRRSSPST